MRRMGFAPLVGIAIAAAFASIPAATAAPTRFTLTFEGAHFADSTLSGGLRHDGRFVASAPVCSTGRGYDTRHFSVELRPLTVLRTHVCDDGSGTFTALMPTIQAEHGGSGGWRIVEGTGRYATLRGFGTYTGTLISGDPAFFETITYRTDWQGVVDFDADPPAIERFATAARKVRQRPRTYVLRAALAIRDTATPVAFTLNVRAGSASLGLKEGSTTSGQVTVTLRIRPPRSVRTARLVLTASDALGNETRTSRSLRLR